MGLDNGLAPNRRQAIIWTNSRFTDANMRHCVCFVIKMNFRAYTKYEKINTVINPCTAEPRYWQKNVYQILVTNALLPLCDESSAATLVHEVRYVTFPLNDSDVLPIIQCVLFLLSTLWKVWHLSSKNLWRQCSSCKRVNIIQRLIC